MQSSHEEERTRVLAFLRDAEELAAERSAPFPGGTVLVQPAYPLIWDVNHVRLDSPWPGHAEDLDTAVERASRAAGLEHRMLAVADSREAERLTPGLAELGWRREQRVVMLLARAPDRAPAALAEQVPAAGVAGIRTAILREAPEVGHEAVRQVLAWEQQTALAAAGQWLAAFADGRPAACARVLFQDGVGQVDDVATLPEMRGRGLAASVVLGGIAALRADGVECIAIVADAHGGPRELYAKLGFDPVALTSRFHRTIG